MQPPGWHRTPAPDNPQDGSAPLEPLVEDGPPAEPERLSTTQSGRYEDFLRSSVDWLWEADADLMLTYVSSPIAHRLGIPAQALAGRPLGNRPLGNRDWVDRERRIFRWVEDYLE